MNIGAHISAARGLHNAPVNSAKIGGECFQFFSRPPQGGKAASLTDASILQFKNAMKEHGQLAAYIHAPYYINLASLNNRIRYGSISVLREELERGSKLGVKAMMTHLGSANDLLKSGMSEEKAQSEGLKMVIEAIQKILVGYKGSCQFLIEMSAGAGLVIGDTFEEISSILDSVDSKKLEARGQQLAAHVGVCLDTQHAFASGYDLREILPQPSLRGVPTRGRDDAAIQKNRSVNVSGSLRSARDDGKHGVQYILNQFDKIIGLDRLVVIHCNDSLTELGSHKDRHADLGDGHIGIETFRTLVQNKKLRNVDLILETPTEEKWARNIHALKKFR